MQSNKNLKGRPDDSWIRKNKDHEVCSMNEEHRNTDEKESELEMGVSYQLHDSDCSPVLKTDINVTNNIPIVTPKKCSIFESTSNVLTLVTGSGMLALPFAAKCLGWSSIILLITMASVYMYAFFLVSRCIELYEHSSRCDYRRIDEHQHTQSNDETIVIDYQVLALKTIGSWGSIVVSCGLCVELGLALVSFFINIGLNLEAIIPSLSPSGGILIACLLSMILSTLPLKDMAYTSALGIAMTLWTLVALVISFFAMKSQPMEYISIPNSLPIEVHRDYQFVQWSGFPISFGIIAFCFGGHGAFPAIRSSMESPASQVSSVLLYSGISISLLYLTIMTLGYVIYAQYVQTPITLSIGHSLLGKELPGGRLLGSMAALGVVCNLQVTCPLITIPIRDLVVRVLPSSWVKNSWKSIYSFLILLLAAVVAWTAQDHLAGVMGLVGSLATTFNSLLLPLYFHWKLSPPNFSSWKERILHGILLVVACVVLFMGTGASLCSLFAHSASQSAVCGWLTPTTSK